MERVGGSARVQETTAREEEDGQLLAGQWEAGMQHLVRLVVALTHSLITAKPAFSFFLHCPARCPAAARA